VIAAALAAALIAGPPPTDAHPIVVGDRTLSRGFLRHWADIAQRAGSDRESARLQAAGLLIRFRWVAGEAAERGVVVTREEVDRSFRKQRDEVFPRRRDYLKFLRESGQSTYDVRYRVRVDLMSDALRELVTEGAVTPQEQQAALDAFVAAFIAKWRPLTTCRAPWINEFDCGATSPGRTRRSPARGRRASRWGGGEVSNRIPSRSLFRPIAPPS
jgi:hypothetical protein